VNFAPIEISRSQESNKISLESFGVHLVGQIWAAKSSAPDWAAVVLGFGLFAFGQFSLLIFGISWLQMMS